jgi:subtilisin family serine protease
MNLIVKIVLFTLLSIANIKAYACKKVDAMELMNAISDNAQSLATRGLTGKGVGIAIIDEMVNKKHPVFANAHIINCGTQEEQKQFTGYHGQYVATPIVGITYPQKKLFESVCDPLTTNKYDLSYWGGLAPETTIYSYPYMTRCERYENNMKIIDTLDQILEHNLKGEDVAIKIINISFELTPEFCETKIVRTFKCIEEAGILVIHAAGNDHAARTIESDSIRAADNWIEVGALHSYKDENKYMGWYGQSYNSGSNHPRTGSNENFIWAAGHLILVAGGDNSFSIQSGTSFAGPYVAAAAALMWERNPSLSYKEIRDGHLSCPIYEIPMNTIQKSGGQTVSFEQNKVQRPVLDIHHLLGLN